MGESKLLQQAGSFMREHVPSSRLEKSGSSDSYFRHVYGARKYALLLAKEYGADPFVVEMAALLHDLGADAGEAHAQKSAEMAAEFLSGAGVPKDLSEKILGCILHHSAGSKADSLEEQIIQDADGIIFLEDTFRFFFERRRAKFSLEDSKKVTLEKLGAVMTKFGTSTGRRLAQELLPKAQEFVQNAS